MNYFLNWMDLWNTYDLSKWIQNKFNKVVVQTYPFVPTNQEVTPKYGIQ